MTNLIYPKFQGWSYEKTITPVWKTITKEAESGLETRIQKWSYPRYKIQIYYNFLTDNSINSITLDKGDIEKLESFFNSVGGTANDFLFKDDVQNSCLNQQFALGDGSTTTFQLIRRVKDWLEPVRGIVEAPEIYVGGERTNAFEFDNYGHINFTAAPPANIPLVWSGQYYFRTRFQDDQLQLQRTFEGLWEGIEVNLITVK